jgi:hypothetical protein
MEYIKIENEDVVVKNPLYSKTVIANILVLITSVLTVVDPALLGIDARYLLMISGALNIALRFVTSEEISIKAFGLEKEKVVNAK